MTFSTVISIAKMTKYVNSLETAKLDKQLLQLLRCRSYHREVENADSQPAIHHNYQHILRDFQSW